MAASIVSAAPSPLSARVRGVRSRRREGALALALYLAAAVGLVGRGALAHPGTGTLGIGPDVQIFLWGLRWWPYAFGHGLDPLLSARVWPPQGGAVLWTTTVPLISVLATPLTLTLGPLVTWNLLVVLAPATAAWAAWLLCAELGAGTGPALAGGAVFGFGSYELCQDIAHPQLSACLLVPLLAAIAVRGVRRGTPPGRLAALTGLIVVAQFLISPELLVTAAIMGVIALLGAAWLLPAERPALGRTARAMAAGALAAAIVLSPLVVIMLVHRPASASGATGWSIDLLNLVVPTARTAVGGSALAPTSSRFPGDLAEAGGYLGVPLLLVITAWGWRERRGAAARLVLGLFAVAIILSLGSRLTVDGTRTIWMPWALVGHLGFMRNVLPARLSMYSSLAAAVILARWLGDSGSGRVVRGLALVAIAVTLWPAGSSFQTEAAAARSPAVRRELAGRRVLALPFFDVHDRALVVQQADDMRFSLTDGWLQLRPPGYALHGSSLTAKALARTRGTSARRLLGEIRAEGITRILLWEPTARLLAGLHLPSRRVAGVVIARVPR